MIITQLKLQSFRAHQSTSLAFGPGVNLLFGSNGAGKTNILEAIHYLCLSKSFLASNDRYALRKGAPFFQVEGSFDSRVRGSIDARMVYVPGEGKKLFFNRSPLERLADVVGRLPVVVASPVDQALTAEGPEVRRRFLDNIISQSRPVYLDDLIHYRRVLKQRNSLLAGYKYHRSPIDPNLLDSWNAELATRGSRIIRARATFLNTFRDALKKAYDQIEGVGEEPKMFYKSIMEVDENDSQEQIYAELLRLTEQSLQKEKETGRTHIGPHRDELYFELDGLAVRQYASQGQHRTFGLALKLAQYYYLSEKLEEEPILLLDDVFGNLDPERSGIVLDLLKSDSFGQSIITATHATIFEKTIPFESEKHRLIAVDKGTVNREFSGRTL